MSESKNNLEQGYVDLIEYDDIEIKYSEELNQFYFLRVGNKFGLPVRYDIMTGEVVEYEELRQSGFRHFCKKSILSENCIYTIEGLKEKYNYILDNKDIYIKNEIKENGNKVVIPTDKFYTVYKIKVVFDSINHEYRFIVDTNVKEEAWYGVLFPSDLKTDSIIYDVITGEIISKEELETYELCDKDAIFEEICYSVKNLKEKLKELNKKYKTR